VVELQNENECTVAGVKYIAVSNDSIDHPCQGCAGQHNAELCQSLHLCTSVTRQDKLNKIWVVDE
jgi:hypothetical protein